MPSDQQYDLIIVGGGPAGLSAAKAAASENLSVLVLEKSLEIGYPVHTSGGSWTKELKQLGIPDKFMHPINTLEFVSSNATASFDYSTPEICIIDIRAVYQYLAEEASLCGAHILTNTIVREPFLEKEKLCGVQAVRNGKPVTFSAKLVIDASGLGAVIASKLGLQNKAVSYGNGAEYEIITQSWQQDKATIMLGSAFSPVGYAWIFPYGENRVRIGIGIIKPQSQADPLKLLEEFINSKHELAQKLKPYSILEVHLGSVPNSGFIDKSYAENLLIVGDSAGQVLGIAGEGIRLALDIGSLAGKTAAEAIRKNNTTSLFLSRYETRWKKKYARSISINRTMNEIIANFTDAKWDKAVNVLKDVDPAIVLALMKGNFDLKLVSLILRKNPGLFAYNAMQIIRKAILQ